MIINRLIDKSQVDIELMKKKEKKIIDDK